MTIPSNKADFALAEIAARQALDRANRGGYLDLIRQKTWALHLAEKARREG
jgi:hypothetical protein